MTYKFGDRVIYRVSGETIETLVADNEDVNNIQENRLEILKIERPKYEIVEEKKELLTEQEKEFLKIYMQVFGFKITELEKENNRLFIWDMGSNYVIEIDESVFKNLEEEKSYTLKELGLEEN